MDIPVQSFEIDDNVPFSLPLGTKLRPGRIIESSDEGVTFFHLVLMVIQLIHKTYIGAPVYVNLNNCVWTGPDCIMEEIHLAVPPVYFFTALGYA